MKNYWILHRATIIVLSITIIVSIIIGYIGCKLIPDHNNPSKSVDTVKIYVPSTRIKTDSLLQDISIQVHEINNKLKKPQSIRYKKRVKAKDDTIRIDASVRVSNNSNK